MGTAHQKRVVGLEVFGDSVLFQLSGDEQRVSTRKARPKTPHCPKKTCPQMDFIERSAPTHVSRPSIEERLASAVDHAKGRIVLVAGPEGCGKTEQMAQWLRRMGAWRGCPVEFFRHLGIL